MRGYTLLRNVSRQNVALYRFEAKIISRGGGGKSTLNAAAYRTGGTANNGKSALSAAAYRHTTALTDELTGKTYDYSRKRGVLGSEILAPSGAPSWTQDRQELWNQVEKIEKRKDAQLARDFIISLPHELNHQQRSAMLTEFLGKQFVEKGYLCDVAYHRPHGKGDDRNHHAHVMVPMRRLTEEGFTRKKDRPEGNPIAAWKDDLATLREDWASTMNRHLEAHGRPERVSHLKLEEQGINRAPEPKQGPLATQIEREGRESHAGNDRRRVKAENAERAAIDQELASVVSLAVEAMKRGKMEEPAEKILEAQAQREADALRELAEQDNRLQQFKKAREAEAEEARKREADRSAGTNSQIENGDIASASARYDASLGKFYSVKNPYESLASAAMDEWATFKADQERLRLEAAGELDQQKRADIEQRRQIEGLEYMATTSQRLSGISATLAGREDAPQAVLDREQAAAYQDQANQMRHERAQQQQEREKRSQEEAEARPQTERPAAEKGDGAHEVSDAKAARRAERAATNAAYAEMNEAQEREGGRGGR